MTNNQPKIEKYAWKGEEYKCRDFLDHRQIVWCGDCYACAKCGLIFVPISEKQKTHQETIQKCLDSLPTEKQLREINL